MSFRIYPYDNTMTGQTEWVVEDTETNRDVASFPYKWLANLYAFIRNAAGR